MVKILVSDFIYVLIYFYWFFFCGMGYTGDKKTALWLPMSPKRKIIKFDHKCLSLSYFCSDFIFGDEKYTVYGETPF